MKHWYVVSVSLCGVFLLGLGIKLLIAPDAPTGQAEKPVPLPGPALGGEISLRTGQAPATLQGEILRAPATGTGDFCRINKDGSITRGTQYRAQTCGEWRRTVAVYAVSEWSQSGGGSIADRWLCYLLDPCMAHEEQ